MTSSDDRDGVIDANQPWLRDHLPIIQNSCMVLRMSMVPPGGSVLDLVGVIRDPATRTVCVGHTHGKVTVCM